MTNVEVVLHASVESRVCLVVPYPVTDALYQSNAGVLVVHTVPSIVTSGRAAVIGLTMCENKFPCPDVAQTSMTVLITRNANLHHHSSMYAAHVQG